MTKGFTFGADHVTAKPDKRPSLLIADDHRVVAQGLELTLREHYPVLGQVHRLDQLEAAIASLCPDVVILDISFGGKSSLPTLARLVAKRSVKARFVVLTGLESRALSTASLEAGATAFLQKGAAVEELLAAIDAAASGRRYFDGRSHHRGPERPPAPFTATAIVGGLTLRARWIELLCLLVDGLTRGEAADRLGISGNGVDYHLREMRQQLGFTSLRSILKWAGEHEAALRKAMREVGKSRAGRG